jgi:hypothetical protein
MPSCNLAESMHHKWNQQSGNRGSDLYIATVDDFIRALMQVVRYYQYLKGDRAGTGPGKEELQLRAAQCTAERTGDPKVLNVAMAKLPGADSSALGRLTWLAKRCSAPKREKPMFLSVLKASHTGRIR